MTEKAVGYTLLAIGIIIMIVASMQAITVFTGKSKPVRIFQSKPVVQQTAPIQKTQEELLLDIQSGDFSSIMNSGMSSGLQSFGIDPNMINDSLNYTVYFFLMQFLLGLGFKLASLGVQMVRPVNVIVRKNPLVGMEENKVI